MSQRRATGEMSPELDTLGVQLQAMQQERQEQARKLRDTVKAMAPEEREEWLLTVVLDHMAMLGGLQVVLRSMGTHMDQLLHWQAECKERESPLVVVGPGGVRPAGPIRS